MRLSLLKSFLLLSAASLAVAYPSNVERSNELTERDEGKVAASWYTGWHGGEFPLDKVPWDKYSHLNYAFRLTYPDQANTSLPDDDARRLKAFVQRAHKEGKKALLSVGGWTGSRYFSQNIGSDKNRTSFAKALLKTVRKYNLDGLENDWEYPNRQGIGCNTISPNDTSNFLAFLQTLRQLADKKKPLLLTAAVSITPFNDASGSPSKDVSAFAELLNWIAIMVYDISGSWSSAVGPNAPVYDSCAPPQYRQGSAESAVKAWTAAGFPASQMLLGSPGFGHSFYVERKDAFDKDGQLVPYPPFNASKTPRGDEWSDEGGPNICGGIDPPGDTFNFWSLIKDGLLQKNGEPAPGVPYRFDNCSKTAFIFRNATSVEISYDGPETYAAKGDFIKKHGLKGFSIWETAGDSNDILLDSIRKSAGF